MKKILVFSVIALSLLANFYLFVSKRSLLKQMQGRDTAIVALEKVIEIIATTDNSIYMIHDSLKKDFLIKTNISQKTDGSFYFVVFPKNDLEKQSPLDFYGLEIIFNEDKNFQQIDFYKP